MDTEQIKQIMEQMMEKAMRKYMDSIFKDQRNLIATGSIAEIDTTSKRARVLLANSTQPTQFIPYPFNYTSLEIGVGQRVFVLTPDPGNASSGCIVAAVGSF